MAGQVTRQTPKDVEALIQDATKRLIEAAHPQRIILFGSYARGDFDPGSDLDFLVVLPTVHDRFAETVRLYGVLRHLGIPVDIVLYSADQVEERKHLRGTMLYHALNEGRVLYDAA